MPNTQDLVNTRKLLHINTAGCVDNGKSTFIGRLLYDSGGLAVDIINKILAASCSDSKVAPSSNSLNLALFTDGLKAEQAQGITIDVARHYVSRDKLDLIIADTPGHEEFTRNMVTGTSDSRVTLILVDATKGIVKQNRRHAYIAALLGVENICVLINKMDLVNFSESRFLELKNEFSELINELQCAEPNYIPISALNGDNVVQSSTNMPWYTASPVLSYLEQVDCCDKLAFQDFRFVVQWIDQIGKKNLDTEIVGQVASGSISAGATVVVSETAEVSTISKITGLDGELKDICFPQQARLQLVDKLNLQRGDTLSKFNFQPIVSNEIIAEICWLQTIPLQAGTKLLLQAGSKLSTAKVEDIIAEVDPENYQDLAATKELALNSIAKVRISTSLPYAWDEFKSNKALGKFILIDPNSKTTAAAGIVRKIIV